MKNLISKVKELIASLASKAGGHVTNSEPQQEGLTPLMQELFDQKVAQMESTCEDREPQSKELPQQSAALHVGVEIEGTTELPEDARRAITAQLEDLAQREKMASHVVGPNGEKPQGKPLKEVLEEIRNKTNNLIIPNSFRSIQEQPEKEVAGAPEAEKAPTPPDQAAAVEMVNAFFDNDEEGETCSSKEHSSEN